MQLSNRLLTEYKKLPLMFSQGTVFCAFDTETTGLHSKTDRIIEIGAVKFNRDGIIDTFDTLINPEISLSSFITQLTGIQNCDVADKPLIKEVLPSFLNFIKDTVFVAHNAQFDLHFLNNELERDGRPESKNNCIDTLRLSRILYPDLESWKLQNLAKTLNINVVSAHRAEDDARVCMELFKVCIKKIEEDGIPKTKRRQKKD